MLGSAFFIASAIQVPMGPFVGPSDSQRPDGPGARLGRVSRRARRADSCRWLLFDRRADVLGMNTVIMALPGVVCYYLFRSAVRSSRERWSLRRVCRRVAGRDARRAALVGGPDAGRQAFVVLARRFSPLHLPVALVEGLVTGSVVVLLRQVRPAKCSARRRWSPMAQEVGDG